MKLNPDLPFLQFLDAWLKAKSIDEAQARTIVQKFEKTTDAFLKSYNKEELALFTKELNE